jgi:hypothetical protein
MRRSDDHAGRPAVRGPLRYLVFLLVAAQIGVVPAVALADSPPTPVHHADHVGSDGDTGCQPFHDELTCLACRVLSTEPVGSAPVPSLPPLSVERGGTVVDAVHAIPGSTHLSGLCARAPPHS